MHLGNELKMTIYRGHRVKVVNLCAKLKKKKYYTSISVLQQEEKQTFRVQGERRNDCVFLGCSPMRKLQKR